MGLLKISKGITIQANGLTKVKKYGIIQSVKQTIQNECVETDEGRLNMGGCKRERKNVCPMSKLWTRICNL